METGTNTANAALTSSYHAHSRWLTSHVYFLTSTTGESFPLKFEGQWSLGQQNINIVQVRNLLLQSPGSFLKLFLTDCALRFLMLAKMKAISHIPDSCFEWTISRFQVWNMEVNYRTVNICRSSLHGRRGEDSKCCICMSIRSIYKRNNLKSNLRSQMCLKSLHQQLN